jgi:methylated-DNA-[protein]-cysteine S-methyltransferase
MNKMKTIQSAVYASPIGDIQMLVEGESLIFLDFADNTDRIEKLMARRYGKFEIIESENPSMMCDRLDRYFNGDWNAFEDLDVDTGGTDFQKTVWKGLRAIPTGQSISYDQLARDIGNPNAIRAAASANANNPVSIVIPCHRVIGKNGAMRGYAGGIERKVWLLRHEGALI